VLAGAASLRARGPAADRDRIFDLGAAALAMYVLFAGRAEISGSFRVIAVFIAATLLGFASHTPAGNWRLRRGDIDRVCRGREGGTGDRGAAHVPILYHFLPFVLALGLFGGLEAVEELARQGRAHEAIFATHTGELSF